MTAILCRWNGREDQPIECREIDTADPQETYQHLFNYFSDTDSTNLLFNNQHYRHIVGNTAKMADHIRQRAKRFPNVNINSFEIANLSALKAAIKSANDIECIYMFNTASERWVCVSKKMIDFIKGEC